MAEPTNAELLARARDGDDAAWEAIVDRFAGLVWSVVRGFRLDRGSEADVFQTVWMRLAEHVDRIREPQHLATWLARTARNESIGLVRQRTRVMPSEIVEDTADTGPDLDDALLRSESGRAVAAGLARISEACQRLLRLLVADPPLSYEEISELLGIPVGSIGPTRGRCLDKLRSTPEVAAIS